MLTNSKTHFFRQAKIFFHPINIQPFVFSSHSPLPNVDRSVSSFPLPLFKWEGICPGSDELFHRRLTVFFRWVIWVLDALQTGSESTCLSRLVYLQFQASQQGFEIFTTCFVHTGMRLISTCGCFFQDHLSSTWGQILHFHHNLTFW